MIVDIVFVVLLLLTIGLTIIPTLPGVPIMFLIALAYGALDGFETLRPGHLALFSGLAVLSLIIDYASGLIGGKLGGASKRAIMFGFIGLMIGLITFPPFGAFPGLFLGVLMGELIEAPNHIKALRAASTSLVASLVGALTNIIIAIAFFITFLVIVF